MVGKLNFVVVLVFFVVVVVVPVNIYAVFECKIIDARCW